MLNALQPTNSSNQLTLFFRGVVSAKNLVQRLAAAMPDAIILFIISVDGSEARCSNFLAVSSKFNVHLILSFGWQTTNIVSLHVKCKSDINSCFFSIT